MLKKSGKKQCTVVRNVDFEFPVDVLYAYRLLVEADVVCHRSNVKLDCKTVGFFLKISKEIGEAWRKSLRRVSHARRFSLVPDLLFDCSRVLEYAKMRIVLQSDVKQLYYSKQENACSIY